MGNRGKGYRDRRMEQPLSDTRHRITVYDILIPLLSFSGPLLVYALIRAGMLAPEMQSLLGSVGPFIGSVLLGIYAYILPRRDIVALVAPVYAMVMFWFPSETAPNFFLQLLFAGTLVVLLIRLKLKYSTPREEDNSGDETGDYEETEELPDEDVS